MPCVPNFEFRSLPKAVKVSIQSLLLLTLQEPKSPIHVARRKIIKNIIRTWLDHKGSGGIGPLEFQWLFTRCRHMQTCQKTPTKKAIISPRSRAVMIQLVMVELKVYSTRSCLFPSLLAKLLHNKCTVHPLCCQSLIKIEVNYCQQHDIYLMISLNHPTRLYIKVISAL